MKPDNWTEISAADNDALMRVQTACSVEDLEALERIVEARINRALAAAPPPPVPAQAESGDKRAWYERNPPTPEQFDRIRELEGEVRRLMRERTEYAESKEFWIREANRLTLTAETARAALEPFAAYADPRKIFPAELVITLGSNMSRRQLRMGDCYAAREALATLSAALREGGKE